MDSNYRHEFIQRFGEEWRRRGIPKMQGLIIAYLLTDETSLVTAAELSRELGISRGSVSMHARTLMQIGIVTLERVPGDRAHYYRANEDMWQDFLQAEQEFLVRQRDLAHEAIPHCPPTSHSYRRLTHMDRYMTWISALDLPTLWDQARRD